MASNGVVVPTGQDKPATDLWARQPSSPQQRVTQRHRHVVEGLPDWEPLPPGELLVRRHRKG